MNTLNTTMVNIYILGALLAIAIILLGMWITRDLKHQKK
jgi:hypothetical protein